MNRAIIAADLSTVGTAEDPMEGLVACAASDTAVFGEVDACDATAGASLAIVIADGPIVSLSAIGATEDPTDEIATGGAHGVLSRGVASCVIPAAASLATICTVEYAQDELADCGANNVVLHGEPGICDVAVGAIVDAEDGIAYGSAYKVLEGEAGGSPKSGAIVGAAEDAADGLNACGVKAVALHGDIGRCAVATCISLSAGIATDDAEDGIATAGMNEVLNGDTGTCGTAAASTTAAGAATSAVPESVTDSQNSEQTDCS